MADRTAAFLGLRGASFFAFFAALAESAAAEAVTVLVESADTGFSFSCEKERQGVIAKQVSEREICIKTFLILITGELAADQQGHGSHLR